MRWLAPILLLALLGGCAAPGSIKALQDHDKSPGIQPSPIPERMAEVAPIEGDKITIAVYSFGDKTGQRKPADHIAHLSSAVTQGAEVWVIKALQDVGNGTWFEVVERVGMDHVIKERQLIRQTREIYEKDREGGPTPLKPMTFAGLILEGGVVGYDANTAVGGSGARYLGIGAQTEYRIDTVTVVMRLVSVSTGQVLMSIATEKSIASVRSGADIFKFLDLGTKLVEAETGFSTNEPVNYAVRAAIEQGVIELVREGERRNLWASKGREGINEKSNENSTGTDVPSSTSGSK